MGAGDSKHSELNNAPEETVVESWGNDEGDEEVEVSENKNTDPPLLSTPQIPDSKHDTTAQSSWATITQSDTHKTAITASTPKITDEFHEEKTPQQEKPPKPTRDIDEKEEKEIITALSEITQELDKTLKEPLSRKSSSGRKTKSRQASFEEFDARSHESPKHSDGTNIISKSSTSLKSLKSQGLTPRYVTRNPEDWDIQVTDIEGFDMNKFKAANQRNNVTSPEPKIGSAQRTTSIVTTSKKTRYSPDDDELISMIEEQY